MFCGSGGGVACLNGSALNNSLIRWNYFQGYSLGDGVACQSQDVNDYMTVNNCTIVGNTASNAGGVYCAATMGQEMWATVRNSVIYDNIAPQSPNYYNDTPDTVYAYCCTVPEPYGPGNITNNPAFVDPLAGDFHLPDWSPCVDAGPNAYAPMPWDLDGNPRIYDDTVDIGCYEFVPEPGVVIGCWLLVGGVDQGFGCRVSVSTKQLSGFGK